MYTSSGRINIYFLSCLRLSVMSSVHPPYSSVLLCNSSSGKYLFANNQLASSVCCLTLHRLIFFFFFLSQQSNYKDVQAYLFEILSISTDEALFRNLWVCAAFPSDAELAETWVRVILAEAIQAVRLQVWDKERPETRTGLVRTFCHLIQEDKGW